MSQRLLGCDFCFFLCLLTVQGFETLGLGPAQQENGLEWGLTVQAGKLPHFPSPGSPASAVSRAAAVSQQVFITQGANDP